MTTHITVLKDEAVEALALRDTSIVIDATLGACGHAKEIVSRLGKRGTMIGIDADQSAIENARISFKDARCTVHLEVGNFKNVDSILVHLHIEEVDAILADLGWRMDQFGGNGRGFSFKYDEDLLMTFGNPAEYPFVARDILNEWDEKDIKNVLTGYGEERFAWRIAQKVVEARATKPIMTTFDFVAIIESAVPVWYRHGRIHPATKSFQALRIAVNDELTVLETFVRKSVELLAEGGRLVIITFHSIEDRVVKHLFKNLAHDHVGTVITKRPVTATREEIQVNPRARSAKMRVFEKHEEKT